MATTRRRYDQNTLHARDTVLRINREDIGKVIADIENDKRLKDVQLNTNSLDAERYEVYVEFTPGERKNAAIALRGDTFYMVSFSIIPKRDYEDDPEKRKAAEVVMETLIEIFRRYKEK